MWKGVGNGMAEVAYRDASKVSKFPDFFKTHLQCFLSVELSKNTKILTFLSQTILKLVYVTTPQLPVRVLFLLPLLFLMPPLLVLPSPLPLNHSMNRLLLLLLLRVTVSELWRL